MRNYTTYPDPFKRNDSYTVDEINRGLHWVNTDYTCPHCGKVQSVAQMNGVGAPCIRCGKREHDKGPTA